MLKNLHALLRFLTEAKQTEAAVRHNCKSYPRSLFLIVSQSCRCVQLTSTRYNRLCTQWLSRELCAQSVRCFALKWWRMVANNSLFFQ